MIGPNIWLGVNFQIFFGGPDLSHVKIATYCNDRDSNKLSTEFGVFGCIGIRGMVYIPYLISIPWSFPCSADLDLSGGQTKRKGP